MRKQNVKQKLMKNFFCLLLATILFYSTACGTILYPERRGQIGTGIDPGVAVMNGVLFLVGVVPGVIAFAVDFSTGAIYLPLNDISDSSQPGDIIFERITYNSETGFSPEQLKSVLYEETGTKPDLSKVEWLLCAKSPALQEGGSYKGIIFHQNMN